MMRDVSHTSVNRNGRAVGDSRHVRLSASLSWIFATALRNTCASSWMGCDILARLPMQCCCRTGWRRLAHRLGGPRIVCLVVVASPCGLFVLSRRSSSCECGPLVNWSGWGDSVGWCATQDCVIVLGDIVDELLVANACTFLENDVVSLDPLHGSSMNKYILARFICFIIQRDGLLWKRLDIHKSLKSSNNFTQGGQNFRSHDWPHYNRIHVITRTDSTSHDISHTLCIVPDLIAWFVHLHVCIRKQSFAVLEMSVKNRKPSPSVCQNQKTVCAVTSAY